MHVSVYKNSPHYNEDAVKNMKCYVNGVDVTTRCFEASEEDGFVKCYKIDEASQKWIVDPETGEPQTELLRGAVKLEFTGGENGTGGL
jgi:hypothetical protein